MIEVDRFPEFGQFVVVWHYNKQIWSATYYQGRTLQVYLPDSDTWEDYDLDFLDIGVEYRIFVSDE